MAAEKVAQATGLLGWMGSRFPLVGPAGASSSPYPIALPSSRIRGYAFVCR